MAYSAASQHDSTKVQINYQLIRNVTSPEEKDNGVQTYIMNAPAEEIADIGTSANLRNYIAEHSARKRNAVHKAIETTILTEPDRFINRNSGITITCSSIKLDDHKKLATLTDASIINGAQTQGEIVRYLTEMVEEDDDVWPEAGFHVRVEINIDPRPASIVETAIARNSATSVQSISQAGARGHLDDLDKIMIEQTGKGIRRSETQTDVHDTFHVLRCARLLMPPEVSEHNSNTEVLRPYMNKAKCLDDFSDWYTRKDTDEAAAKKYQFVLDIASRAIAEYEHWEKSDYWHGNRIWEDTQKGGRACRRDKNGNVVWMSPGLMYPLLNAISALVVEKSEGHWIIDKPRQFKSSEMIRRTVQTFREHDSKPMLMGRSPLAYSSLINYPQTLIELIREFEAA